MDLSDEELKKLAEELEEVERDRNAGKRGYTIEELDRIPDFLIGLDDFTELRSRGYYYVDKTGLIADIMSLGSDVFLFTRPRRFGKTLNMTMIRDFFSLKSDKSVFEGLEILENRELCDEYMGKVPVIYMTMKDVRGNDWDSALEQLREIVSAVAYDLFTADDAALLQEEKGNVLKRLIGGSEDVTAYDLIRSLSIYQETIYRKTGIKPILLIDEYDVPLAKAHANGYWDKMLALMGGMYSRAMKSSGYLFKAVLTGCLKVARESVFTGLNNLSVLGVSEDIASDRFGFTDTEMHELLCYYGLSAKWDEYREWYDGYRFGNTEIWCPWDVLSYTEELCLNPRKEASSHWVNTSSNDWLHFLVDHADAETRRCIEILMDGGVVEKKLNQNITYQDIGSDIENLWSLLFMTGYLTTSGRNERGEELLRIPNRAVRTAFEESIAVWFRRYLKTQNDTGAELASALLSGDARLVTSIMYGILSDLISVRDYSGRGAKENFYQGLLVGLLGSALTRANGLRSNSEAGNGYADILFTSDDGNVGVVLELKYADSNASLERSATGALEQIDNMKYAEGLRRFLYPDAIVRKYGISFHHKDCLVLEKDE